MKYSTKNIAIAILTISLVSVSIFTVTFLLPKGVTDPLSDQEIADLVFNREEEKLARANKIQEEYKVAASVPMKTVRACKKVLDILLELGTKGNTSTASDMAVAALNALIGLRSAAMNVEINLPSIKNEEFKNNAKSELTELMVGLEEAVHALIKSAKSKF